jgi:hypothetical protein
MDTPKINKAQSEDNCSNCVLYRKEIDELKEAFIEADFQGVRQQAEIKRLKAERSSEKSKQQSGVRGG